MQCRHQDEERETLSLEEKRRNTVITNFHYVLQDGQRAHCDGIRYREFFKKSNDEQVKAIVLDNLGWLREKLSDKEMEYLWNALTIVGNTHIKYTCR